MKLFTLTKKMQTIPRDVMTSHILPYLTVGESVRLLFVLGEATVLKTQCPKDIRHYYDKKLWFLRIMCVSDDSNNFLQSYFYWTNVFEKTWPIIAHLPLPRIDDWEPLCRSESWAWRCLQEEVESELSHDLDTIDHLRRLIHTRYFHNKPPTPIIYCTA